MDGMSGRELREMDREWDRKVREHEEELEWEKIEEGGEKE